MERQAPRLAALGRHHEDVEVAEPVAGERDPLAVVAPDRHEVVGLVQRQRHGGAASRRDAVEVALVGEDHRLAVRRDGGVAQPLGARLRGSDAGGTDGHKDRTAASIVCAWFEHPMVSGDG